MKLNNSVNTIIKNLIDLRSLYKKGQKLEIECAESFLIASIISSADFTNTNKVSRIWIIGPDDDFLLSLSADCEHYFKKSAIIKNKDNIKRLFDTQNNLFFATCADLNKNFPLLLEKDIPHFDILKDKELKIDLLLEFLQKSGYSQTPCVQNESEFSLRGEVVDIFPNSSKKPYRVYLDFDMVEKIASFDVSSQLVRDNDEIIDKLVIQPNIDEDDNEFCTLKDYIKDDDVVILVQSESLNKEEIFNRADIIFYSIPLAHEKAICIPSSSARGFKGEFEELSKEINLLIEKNQDVFLICDTQIQKNRIESLLFSFDEKLKDKVNKNLFFEICYVSKGFSLDEKITVFTQFEIFSKRHNKYNNDLARLQTVAIDSFFALKEGDLVVHSDYGVGKFVSLERITMQGTERDYIKIEYQGEEFYYVPLERANCVQKYIGKEKINLDNLHSSAWKRKKEKARENARIFAQKLLHLYALRKKQNAFCHNPDTPWMLKFESEFEYEETQDQMQAIEDVKHDMESNKIMDRIICGDVGFGKTEVAFRAAFKAILSGKQVCFLSPTTILTTQHFNNFCARSSNFPINIAQYSRIISAKEAREIKEKIENGDVDIVFATHKILRSEIKFKNLGLLIIDEEQRFGVNDKEKIKSLKLNVDTLTLTATPIPRTLYMSMIHLRDISLLKTPPSMRLAVKIFVDTYSWDRVKKGIENELERGGQVYYLHNKTEDIDIIRSFLKQNFKDAKVEAISGKMDSVEIENKIYDFATGQTDILVCTTIIENGIDVPNANTLIVDDATIYGTSQLYQIKGRVGRSNRQGYAYLMIPKNKPTTKGAVERIKVIAQNSTLGSGFNIAMNDLLLRGSGNILGKEQAGHVEEIGLDMYMNLLDRSIKELEEEKNENKDVANINEDWEPGININYTAYIPDEYINETELKFNIYKKIANASSKSELEGLMANVQNRFGSPPDVVQNLYSLSVLKIAMKKSGIDEVCEKGDLMIIKVRKIAMINVDKLMTLIREKKGKIYLDAKRPNFIIVDAKGIKSDERLDYISHTIDRLA